MPVKLAPFAGFHHSSGRGLVDAAVETPAQPFIVQVNAVRRDDRKIRGHTAVEQGRHEFQPGQVTAPPKITNTVGSNWPFAFTVVISSPTPCETCPRCCSDFAFFMTLAPIRRSSLPQDSCVLQWDRKAVVVRYQPHRIVRRRAGRGRRRAVNVTP